MRLYRTVSPAELDDIRAHDGAFRDSIHKTGEKGFFYSLEDAAKLAVSLERMEGEHHIVVITDAPDSLPEQRRQHNAAQEGPGVYLLVSDLSQLGPAEEVES